MSFTRIKYDNDAYDLKINREIGPGDYRLFKGFNENCKKCSSYDGSRNSKSDVAIVGSDSDNQWGSMAEAESYLTNRVNKLTDSNVYGSNDGYKNLIPKSSDSCVNFLEFEDTRFTNPIEAYRCMDLTSYHYVPFLYVNSQCELQDDRIGLNSRLKVKDSFKVSIPIVKDQDNTLPSNNKLNDSSNLNHDSNLNQGNKEPDLCMNI